jgi:hypothetical protein
MSDLTATKLYCLVCNAPAEYLVFDAMMCRECSELVDTHKVQAKAAMTGALVALVVQVRPPSP